MYKLSYIIRVFNYVRPKLVDFKIVRVMVFKHPVFSSSSDSKGKDPSEVVEGAER